VGKTGPLIMPPRRGALCLLFLALLLVWLALGRRTAEVPLREPALITGEVTSADGPLAGVRVRFKADALLATTDPAGRFRLPPGDRSPQRITAAREGYLIAGLPAAARLSFRLHPLPGDDFEGYAWVDPRPDPEAEGNCGNCHGPLHREWAASAHA